MPATLRTAAATPLVSVIVPAHNEALGIVATVRSIVDTSYQGDVEVVEETGGSPVGTPTGGTASGGELTALAAYAFALGPVRLGLAGRWLRLDVAGLFTNDEAGVSNCDGDCAANWPPGTLHVVRFSAKHLGEPARLVIDHALDVPREHRVAPEPAPPFDRALRTLLAAQLFEGAVLVLAAIGHTLVY